MNRSLLKVLFFLLILFLLTGCSRLPITETKYLLGTEVTFTIHSHDKRLRGEMLFAAIDEGFREIERIEGVCKKGELRLLNGYSGNKYAPIGDELSFLIDHAYDIAGATNGAFRPDLGPLVRLWGIGTDNARIPEYWEIDDALEIVESTFFSMGDSGMARLDPAGASLDLGAIAKGYAVDRACEVLRKYGVTAAMVWAGGDLRVWGTKPDGKPWRIGVRHPRNQSDFLAVLTIDSGAVATSGDYERYFEFEGGKYHHILDPEEGAPSRASISSTVYAPTCMDADAYATAMFVLGPEKGMEVANQLGVPAYIMDKKSGRYIVRKNEYFERLEEE